MKQLPKSILVEGKKYRIKQVYLQDTDDLDVCGFIIGADQTILIDRRLSLPEKWETLLHEVLHILNWRLGENTVTSLSSRLFGVLVSNDLLKI